MRRKAGLTAAAFLILAGSAVSGQPFRGRGRPQYGGGMARLFVSPAGQVFRGAPGEPPPMEAWFRQADTDGDGMISFAEFQADFRRAFAEFDSDHDGEIAPNEVAHYETVTFPEMASGGRGGFGRGGRHGGGRGMGGGDTGDSGDGESIGASYGGPSPHAPRYMLGGAARFGLLPISHPIMEADKDFNRGVSQTEWDEAAASRFTQVDSAHNGRLTLEGLIELRRHPPGE